MPDHSPDVPPRSTLPKWALVLALAILLALQERQSWPIDASTPDLLSQILNIRAMLIGAIIAALVGQTPPVITAVRAVASKVPGLRNYYGGGDGPM